MFSNISQNYDIFQFMGIYFILNFPEIIFLGKSEKEKSEYRVILENGKQLNEL